MTFAEGGLQTTQAREKEKENEEEKESEIWHEEETVDGMKK